MLSSTLARDNCLILENIMTSALEKIKTACEWLHSKSNGDKNVTKVTTQVKWADWDRKYFSPAMAVLWYSEVHRLENNTYNTFLVPDSATWISKVANYLETSEDWVRDFVNQCHNGLSQPEQYTLSVTFDGLGSDHKNTYSNIKLKNPRLEWKRIEPNNDNLLIEAKYCLETYGNSSKELPAIPYWTKNPPLKNFESKVVDAVFDLFSAIQASESKM